MMNEAPEYVIHQLLYAHVVVLNARLKHQQLVPMNRELPIASVKPIAWSLIPLAPSATKAPPVPPSSMLRAESRALASLKLFFTTQI
jgi:hypothetical protein